MARNSLIGVADWRECRALGAAMPHRPLPSIWRGEPDLIGDDLNGYYVRLARANDWFLAVSIYDN